MELISCILPSAFKYQRRNGCMHDKFHSPLLVAREPSGVSKESADAFDGEVRAADRQYIQGDIPFVPEIYVNGEPRPLCFAGRNEAEVNAVCKAAGFPFGGSIVKRTDDVYGTDAIPVSACFRSTFFFCTHISCFLKLFWTVAYFSILISRWALAPQRKIWEVAFPKG